MSEDNCVRLLLEQAEQCPDEEAIRIPLSWSSNMVTEYHTITYNEVVQRSGAFQAGFSAAGFKAGDRIVLMLAPSVELYCLVSALLSSGLVVVFIDPAMGFKKIIMALHDAKACALVSSERFLKFRPLILPLWRIPCFSVDCTRWFSKRLKQLQGESQSLHVEPQSSDSHALITFTSGSTGRPKGADRTHGSLLAQHFAMSNYLQKGRREIDMTCMPVLALHNMCCGWTTVFPALDAGLGDANGALVCSQIKDLGVSRLTGVPAFFKALTDYALNENFDMPSVEAITVGGATVHRTLVERMQKAFSNVRVDVLYGSTEVEPISGIYGDELLASEGEGYLVGKPVPEALVAIVDLPEHGEEITDLSLRSYGVPLGEIVVKGGHVLKGYVDNPVATRENKIPCADGEVWHRTGDIGYFDEQGRIWLTGRQNDVVKHCELQLQPYLLENQLDCIGGVVRSALIQGPNKQAVLCVELLADEMFEAMPKIKSYLSDNQLQEAEVIRLQKIPVDVRHNSKIDRHQLRTQLASGKLSVVTGG